MKIAIFIFCLFAMIQASAQDRQLFEQLIAQGKYEDAKIVLNVLDNKEPEMTWVNACIELQKEARSLYQKEYYTKAIEKYRLIKRYFPSDRTVDAAIRQCEIKRDEYNRMQEQKRREEQARQARSAEEEQWQRAVILNTKVGYIDYLNKYPAGKYRATARARLFDLYVNDARNSYSSGDYRDAVNSFDMASKYGTLSLMSGRMYRLAKEKMEAQQEGSRYEALMSGAYPSPVQLETFLKDYPQSLHSPMIRGKLLDRYCELGRFDDARRLVEDNPEGIALTEDVIPDADWWMKNIRQRERKFSKASKKSRNKVQRQRKQTSFNAFDGLGIMLSAGASMSYTSRKEMETKQYQGIVTEEEEVVGGAFLGPRVAFSLGNFYNRFNLEIRASYAYSGELGSQFPLAVAPRWNIVADAFHLYVQPEVGYDVMRNGMFYSGRVGIGCLLGSLFFGVSYNRTVFDRIQYQIGYVYDWQWDL